MWLKLSYQLQPMTVRIKEEEKKNTQFPNLTTSNINAKIFEMIYEISNMNILWLPRFPVKMGMSYKNAQTDKKGSTYDRKQWNTKKNI